MCFSFRRHMLSNSPTLAGNGRKKCQSLSQFANVISDCKLLTQGKPVAKVIWSFSLAVFLLRQMLRKQVEKGSVIILPAFGVQLETIYRSGRTVRRFVPIGKILKPVLNECVTPVTCYWSLSLILRGEEELLLVFKELYPPVSMLVPIWKALSAAIDNKERPDLQSDCDTR
ncbi:uncharacterized protein LOC105178658 isoform X2 [Sesamum indicum]|uniref:Uncharacterized protein LOC105178658 isoform X2 n=1 Tax=Sesamum indicum TaxID=4182 RepID=A0A6I9UGA2_SESIN|nr:uncharacterized protein LOC105178658 isoform X2 [Sesamum indicum]